VHLVRPGMAVCGLALLLSGAKNLVAVSPAYTASSIVNSASGVSAVLVPNGLATVYGTNLSAITQAITPSDIKDGVLPLTLNGTGVSVLVGGLRAPVLYASPSQVNFLVPTLLSPGPTMVEVVRSGASGGPVKVLVAGAMPAETRCGDCHYRRRIRRYRSGAGRTGPIRGDVCNRVGRDRTEDREWPGGTSSRTGSQARRIPRSARRADSHRGSILRGRHSRIRRLVPGELEVA
jgi:hypothetical protein